MFHLLIIVPERIAGGKKKRKLFKSSKKNNWEWIEIEPGTSTHCRDEGNSAYQLQQCMHGMRDAHLVMESKRATGFFLFNLSLNFCPLNKKTHKKPQNNDNKILQKKKLPLVSLLVMLQQSWWIWFYISLHTLLFSLVF